MQGRGAHRETGIEAGEEGVELWTVQRRHTVANTKTRRRQGVTKTSLLKAGDAHLTRQGLWPNLLQESSYCGHSVEPRSGSGGDKPLPYETKTTQITVGEGFIPSRDDDESFRGSVENSIPVSPWFTFEDVLESLGPLETDCERERLARDERARIACLYLLGEFSDRLPDDGVDPVGHDLGGGDQGERPLVQAGMGNLELGAAPDEIPGREQVEIEDSRAPALLGVAIPAGRDLEIAAGVKQGRQITRPLNKDGGVAIVGLIRSERSGSPQTRDGNDISGRRELVDRG